MFFISILRKHSELFLNAFWQQHSRSPGECLSFPCNVFFSEKNGFFLKRADEISLEIDFKFWNNGFELHVELQMFRVEGILV